MFKRGRVPPKYPSMIYSSLRELQFAIKFKAMSDLGERKGFF